MLPFSCAIVVVCVQRFCSYKQQQIRVDFACQCLAQDKAYLVKTLLHDGTPVKPQKVKRKPGSSGRLHKTDDGEWVWSDDECTDETTTTTTTTLNDATVKSDSSGDDKTPPQVPSAASAGVRAPRRQPARCACARLRIVE